MKKSILGILMLSSVLKLSAGIYVASDANGGNPLNLGIPDGNPNGVTSSLTVSGEVNRLSSVTVTLNISGGYNGDLYAYLSYNGTAVTLLNRVGTGTGGTIQNLFGFSTAGLTDVTLSDGGAGGNIHGVSAPNSGINYTPDGGSLSAFGGMDPNGTWTLFFADRSGGSTSTLQDWTLAITPGDLSVSPVPEPTNVAMAIFGAGFVGLGFVRAYRGSRPATR
jgi:subtilisin-like proprotein convertase family protein